MRPIIILSFLSLLLFNCKGQYTIDELPEKLLVFGSGGGMTGAVTTYTLLENGQLFSNNSITKEHQELEKLPKKTAKAFFEKMQALELSKTDFNHPGNLYYFIKQVDGEEYYTVTWGSQDHEVSADCEALYKELFELIK